MQHMQGRNSTDPNQAKLKENLMRRSVIRVTNSMYHMHNPNQSDRLVAILSQYPGLTLKDG